MATVRVEFPRALQVRMRKVVVSACRREIGGILMAEQLEPGSFRIVDFSVDPVKGTAVHFLRSPEHHQQALEDFFARTGSDYRRYNYLGEWHSHPNHDPLPSSTDIAAMNDVMHSERNISFAVLLIVRTRFWRKMECSLTHFQKGIKPEFAELVST